MAELSGYFLGMNIYDQRGSGDSHSTPSHSTYPLPPPSTNQMQNVQSIQSNYWQSPPNQIPVRRKYHVHFLSLVRFYLMNLFSPNRPCTLCLHLERQFPSVRIQGTGSSCISSRDSQRITLSTRKQ